MYVWVGINVDDQLSEVRRLASAAEAAVGTKNSCYTLPMHISLKISFPVDDARFDEIVDRILDYFGTAKPFDASVRGVERENTIAWIRYAESDDLKALSVGLNEMLLRDFGIGLHPYDNDFKFHSTLFMDDDADKVVGALERMGTLPLPDAIKVRRFVVGCSPTGALGTYQVYREIMVE